MGARGEAPPAGETSRDAGGIGVGTHDRAGEMLTEIGDGVATATEAAVVGGTSATASGTEIGHRPRQGSENRSQQGRRAGRTFLPSNWLR